MLCDELFKLNFMTTAPKKNINKDHSFIYLVEFIT
jgi:hypothetical protein